MIWWLSIVLRRFNGWPRKATVTSCYQPKLTPERVASRLNIERNFSAFFMMSRADRLNGHSRADAVVLADFEISNHIPQYTHNIVFCAYDNAVHFDDKLKALQQFLDPKTSNEFRERLIQQNAIHFVLLTAAEERELPAVGEAPFLKEVFRNHAAVVYSVTSSQQMATAEMRPAWTAKSGRPYARSSR